MAKAGEFVMLPCQRNRGNKRVTVEIPVLVLQISKKWAYVRFPGTAYRRPYRGTVLRAAVADLPAIEIAEDRKQFYEVREQKRPNTVTFALTERELGALNQWMNSTQYESRSAAIRAALRITVPGFDGKDAEESTDES